MTTAVEAISAGGYRAPHPSLVDARGIGERSRFESFTGWSMAVLLVIQLGELYAPAAALLGLPTLRLVTVVTVLASGTALALGWRKSIYALRYPVARLWLYAIFVAPVFAMTAQFIVGIMSLDDYYYWVIVVTTFGMMYLMALYVAIWIPRRTVELVIFLAIGAALLGFVVQLSNPSFASKVLAIRLREESISLSGISAVRVRGFFAQPNTAALTMVFCTALTLLSFAKLRSFYGPAALFIACATTVVLTSSRTSLLLFVIVTMFVFFVATRHVTNRQLAWVIVNLIGGIALLVLLYLALPAGKGVSNDAFSLGIERMLSIGQFFDSDGVEDVSASIRAEVIPLYFDYSLNSPLLGYGKQATETLAASRSFGAVSQNLWLQSAIEYGYVYTFFAAGVFWWTFAAAGRIAKIEPYVARSARNVQFFVFLLFVASFSLNTLLLLRVVVIGAGVLVGLLVRDLMHVRAAPPAVSSAGPIRTMVGVAK